MQNYVMIQDPATLQMLQAQAPSMPMDFESLQNLNSLQNLSDEDLEQLFWTKKQWRSGAAKVGKFALHAAPLALAFAWLIIYIHTSCALIC